MSANISLTRIKGMGDKKKGGKNKREKQAGGKSSCELLAKCPHCFTRFLRAVHLALQHST